jgi:hypothetical protein
MFNADTPYSQQIDTILVTHTDSISIDTQLIFFSTNYLFPFINIGYQHICNLLDSANFIGSLVYWDSTYNDVAWSSLAPVWGDARFQKGLGMTYYYSTNNDGYDPIADDYYNLIYYSKGNTHSGTPYYSSTLRINDLANISNVKVYPNPTSELLTLSVTNAGQYNAQFIITSIFGQEIYSMPVTQDESTCDISKLSAGMYMWRMVSDNSIIKTSKFIKQ